MTLRIMHVNLARGFRGGERQTELLIQTLAAHGVSQQLVCRGDSPLRAHLQGTPGLKFVTANHQLMGHWRAEPAEMEKLTTPQRIERRQQMMAQRMSAMNARAEATKTFYNALRPEQRTIFDQQTARGGHRGGAMGGDNPGAGHRHG